MWDNEKRQEFAAKTYKLLKKQGRRSTRSCNDCVYRDAAGRGCAIGVHIPEEAYKPEWDNRDHLTDIKSVAKRDPEILVLLDAAAEDVPFLSNVQHTHDGCLDDDFERTLRVRFVELCRIWTLSAAFLE